MSHPMTRIDVYGICIKANRVLMVRTMCGTKSIYNFPGGGVGSGERFVDTLRRECLEEIGCNVQVGSLVCINDKTYYSVDFDNDIFSVYYAITLEGIIDYTLQEAQWFTLSALPLNAMLECDKDVVTFLY